MLSAEPETAGNAWSVSTEKIETSVHSLSFATPMPPADHLATLSEITLPYIEGLSLSDHARIIRDEEDILNEFRKEMRQLAQMASERKIHVDEFRRDVIDPRVSRISRKLKHISNMHLIKTSGAVFVTCALSLIASQSKGMLGGLEVMVGGAGAASMVKDVVDRENQIHALKDDPLFLLWKMSQRSQ